MVEWCILVTSTSKTTSSLYFHRVWMSLVRSKLMLIFKFQKITLRYGKVHFSFQFLFEQYQAYGGQPQQRVKCASFSQNYRDFIIDLTPLANICAKIENQRPAAEQRLSAYIDNVRQTMIAESSRRYTLYNIRLSMDSTKTPEEKQKKRTEDKAKIDEAMTEYNKIVDDATTGYKKQVADLIKNLAPTAMQSCLATIQNTSMQQVSNAAALIAIIPQMCIDMEEAYKTFTNSLNGVYQQIGVNAPNQVPSPCDGVRQRGRRLVITQKICFSLLHLE